MRGRIVALPSLPARPPLRRDDLLASFAIFLIVVAATFPVVLPFAIFSDVATAKIGLALRRARDAVLRRPRARALRGLRQLESRPHDGRTRHRARDRDQRARRMNAALSVVAVLAAVIATSAFAARGETGGTDGVPCRYAVVGVRDQRVSHGRSRRRQLHVGDRDRRSRPASPRGQVQLRVGRRALGVRRLEFLRRRHDHVGTDAAARRRLGHDAGVRARAGGERGLGSGRRLHRSRIRARQPRLKATATSTPGASWDTGPPSGSASGSPASAPESTAATAISSADRSRRSPSTTSRSADTGSTRARAIRSSSASISLAF